MLVGNCNKINVLRPDAIDDGVRKTGNDPPAKATGKRRARLGTDGNPVCGLLHRGKKTQTESIETRLIEFHGLADFRPSLRVEYQLFHDRSFARSSAKTSRAGIPWTTPSRSS